MQTHRRTSPWLGIGLIAGAIGFPTLAAEHPAAGSNAVNVRSFVRHVVKPGADEEDWQPAFQKAIEVAQRDLRPIFVPAGVYHIRKAIHIVPVPKEGEKTPFGFHALRIAGEGRELEGRDE